MLMEYWVVFDVYQPLSRTLSLQTTPHNASHETYSLKQTFHFDVMDGPSSIQVTRWENCDQPMMAAPSCWPMAYAKHAPLIQHLQHGPCTHRNGSQDVSVLPSETHRKAHTISSSPQRGRGRCEKRLVLDQGGPRQTKPTRGYLNHATYM